MGGFSAAGFQLGNTFGTTCHTEPSLYEMAPGRWCHHNQRGRTPCWLGSNPLPVLLLLFGLYPNACLLELPWMFPGSLLRYHEKIQGSCCHSVALRQLCTLLYCWALLILLRLESGSRPVDPRCCHEHVLLTELCQLCWTVLYQVRPHPPEPNGTMGGFSAAGFQVGNTFSTTCHTEPSLYEMAPG